MEGGLAPAKLAARVARPGTVCQIDSDRAAGYDARGIDLFGGLLMPRWLNNWLLRHQHPVSLALHVVAVPMLPAAGVLVVTQLIAGAWGLWWRPVGLFVVSYILQWIGHCIEGNDMGELVLIKRWLGRPYVAIAPRYLRSPSSKEAQLVRRTLRPPPSQ